MPRLRRLWKWKQESNIIVKLAEVFLRGSREEKGRDEKRAGMESSVHCAQDSAIWNLWVVFVLISLLYYIIFLL